MINEVNERARKIFHTIGEEFGKFQTEEKLDEFTNRCTEKLSEIIIENGKEQKEKAK